jgi:hypothetical protein
LRNEYQSSYFGTYKQWNQNLFWCQTKNSCGPILTLKDFSFNHTVVQDPVKGSIVYLIILKKSEQERTLALTL